jgi:CRISPR-associated exonuclease Cas4
MYPVAEREPVSQQIPLAVTDLKQYLYCPRIPYFQHVLTLPRPVTFKMKHGTLQHLELDRLEKRRGLRSYGLREGQRMFHVPVTSHALGLHGVLDLVIKYQSKQNTCYLPVEFKYQEGPIRTNVKYQLAAYAMLLEEVYQTPVNDGVVYQIPTQKVRHVHITEEMRIYVQHTLSAIRNMMQKESFPDPKTRARCGDCEYRRYCNDIR